MLRYFYECGERAAAVNSKGFNVVYVANKKSIFPFYSIVPYLLTCVLETLFYN